MDGKYLKVLLIGDHPRDAEVLDELLSKDAASPFQLEWAVKLAQGKARLEADETSVLLLDLSSSESQGVDTYLEIQAHAPELPIIILASTADEPLAIQAVREGAEDYLVKEDLDRKVLVRSLRYAIERHKLLSTIQSLPRDYVTGLYNLQSFSLLAEHQMNVARRAKRGLWLFFIKTDRYWMLNGRVNCRERNRLLSRVAGILTKTFRVSDIIARFRCDEFVVLTVDAGPDTGDIVKQRLLDNLKQDNDANERFNFSLTVGAALFDPERTLCIGQLLTQADGAMFEQKRIQPVLLQDVL